MSSFDKNPTKKRKMRTNATAKKMTRMKISGNGWN
jgi:hypothetical protein